MSELKREIDDAKKLKALEALQEVTEELNNAVDNLTMQRLTADYNERLEIGYLIDGIKYSIGKIHKVMRKYE